MMKSKKNNKNLLDNIEKIVRDIENKINYKKSYKYIFALVIIVAGYTFFLTSGFLFDKDNNIMNTEINSKIALNNSEIKIIKTKYSDENNLLQVNLGVKNTNINFNNDISATAIARENLNKELELRLEKLSEYEYIILIKIPKKWSTISININEEKVKDPSSTKLYIDKRETEEKSDLKELLNEEYLIENANVEIEKIKVNILNYEEDIKENESLLVNIDKEILKLEDSKKYQIEGELIDTNQRIETHKSDIEVVKNIIEQLKSDIGIEEAKIDKLELKKSDLSKQLP